MFGGILKRGTLKEDQCTASVTFTSCQQHGDWIELCPQHHSQQTAFVLKGPANQLQSDGKTNFTDMDFKMNKVMEWPKGV